MVKENTAQSFARNMIIACQRSNRNRFWSLVRMDRKLMVIPSQFRETNVSMYGKL